MRRSVVWIGLVAILLFLAGDLYGAEKTGKKIRDLPLRYRKWITEEVGYIITGDEKAAFLSLNSVREWEIFIKAFWEHRDPDPGTLENEAKTEHYRRLKKANEVYGRGTPTPGWKTDRGKTYILLGEPDDITEIETRETIPVIVWFYQGLGRYGIPEAFNVMFFRRHNAGDWVYYSPVTDGPSALMNFQENYIDRQKAYRRLRLVEPKLADLSLSLIDNESVNDFQGSIASEIIIKKKIREVPKKKIDDTYARNMIKYRGQVDMEYSTNYLKNDSVVQVIRNQDGHYYIHYLFEPSRLTVAGLGEGGGNTVFEVFGSLQEVDSPRMVYNFNKEVPANFSSRDLEQLQKVPFSFRDIIPVIPGRYRLQLFVQNRIAREYTVIEETIHAGPGDDAGIQTAFLANGRKPSGGNDKIKSFRVGNEDFTPLPKRNFTRTDPLIVFCQIYSVTNPGRGGGELEYSLHRMGKASGAIVSRKVRIRQEKEVFQQVEAFSLRDLDPDYYIMRVRYLPSGDGAGEAGQRDLPFFVSPREEIPRAWSMALFYRTNAPEIDNILGTQYFNRGRFDRALSHHERAFHRRPGDVLLTRDYCRSLYRLKRFEEIVEIVRPFRNNGKAHQLMVLGGNASFRIGEYRSAIEYFKLYIQYFGLDHKVLNSIGDSYRRLGDIPNAVQAYRKSLEYHDRQPEIRDLLAEIQKEGE